MGKYILSKAFENIWNKVSGMPPLPPAAPPPPNTGNSTNKGDRK